jgi:hypothetical protein
MHRAVKGIHRSLISLASFVLPEEKTRTMERLRRGKEEQRRLQIADYVFVSFGKSGRTWLRVMLSRYMQLTYDLPERTMLRFDNFHQMNAAAPRIFFTHGNYVRDVTGDFATKHAFYHTKVLLLVRRPQDVAVSQYFQWKYRMPERKKKLNGYPTGDEDLSLFDFTMDPKVGVAGIIDFMNGWADELANLKDHLVVRYEDVHADPPAALGRMVTFLGMERDDARINEAVRFSSVDNMRELERKQYFRGRGIRLKAKDDRNPDSYKVRRAKVGGYRDYFDDGQLAEIDALVDARLSPVFGYRREDEPADAAGSGKGASAAPAAMSAGDQGMR